MTDSKLEALSHIINEIYRKEIFCFLENNNNYNLLLIIVMLCLTSGNSIYELKFCWLYHAGLILNNRQVFSKIFSDKTTGSSFFISESFKKTDFTKAGSLRRVLFFSGAGVR